MENSEENIHVYIGALRVNVFINQNISILCTGREKTTEAAGINLVTRFASPYKRHGTRGPFLETPDNFLRPKIILSAQ